MTSPQDDTIVLEPGDAAPGFAGEVHPGGRIELARLLGRGHVVLAFYPADGAPNSTRELQEFSALLEEFDRAGASVLGVSCESLESHAAFAADQGIRVPLLADPDGSVGRMYGAVRGDRYMADRVLFVIDRSGVIRFRHEDMPDVPQVLALVRSLSASPSPRAGEELA